LDKTGAGLAENPLITIGGAQMKARTRNISKALATSVVVVGIAVLGLVASTALSATKDSGVTPTVVSSSTNASVVGAKASASDVATGKVTILSYVKAKGLTKRQVRNSHCRTIGAGTNVPVFWNSGRGANGSLYWFRDSRTTRVCGNRKVNCGNFVRYTRPKSHVVTGRVVMVRSLASVKVRLHAYAKVEVTATCGSASAEAESVINISLKQFVKANGNATQSLYDKVVAKATAKASAKIECVVTPPVTTTTPGTTTTTTTTTTPPVSPTMEVKNVTSPEEVNSDGETYPNLFGDVYGPNGDSITVVFSVVNPNDHSQGGLGSIVGQRSFIFTSHGYDRIGPSTYQAPSDQTAVGRNDQIEVTAHDNSNPSVKDASSFSLPFPIKAPPVNP
jgi:hypothetical protein